MKTMTTKLQCISYLILIIIFIDQGDGRWNEREKEELLKDFMAYKKSKQNLQKYIEELYDHHSREVLFRKKYEPLSELDFLKRALVKPEEEMMKLLINLEKSNRDKQNKYIFKPTNEKIDKNLNKTSKSKITKENSGSYSGWPKFEDLLRASGKMYDWKNDRWIKVKNKNELFSAKNDENPTHNYVKHEFIYKILKANKTNKKRKNVVVVTAVR